MSTIIPDISAAEGVVVHWLRSVFEESEPGRPESLYNAAGDAIRGDLTDDELGSDADFAFRVGAEFGVRVALAVAASPLGGIDTHLKGAASEAVSALARYSLDEKTGKETRETAGVS